MLTALVGVLWLHHGICECPGSLQTVVITFNDEIQFRAQTAHRIGALTAAVCGIYMSAQYTPGPRCCRTGDIVQCVANSPKDALTGHCAR